MNFKCANRTTGKASAEVISDRTHDGLNGGFEEPRNLCSVCAKV